MSAPACTCASGAQVTCLQPVESMMQESVHLSCPNVLDKHNKRECIVMMFKHLALSCVFYGWENSYVSTVLQDMVTNPKPGLSASILTFPSHHTANE